MTFLSVQNISQKLGDLQSLSDVSFTLDKGKRLAIAGETGSGKTMLMQVIAGLDQADSGEVYFEGQRVKGVYEKMMPGHKGIAYLSQHYELRRKYRVAELLEYANRLTDEGSAMLYKVCRVDHLLQRWSHTLSGGEKQRVALAKLLTETPELLVLDEPYSNLDLIHKLQLREVIWDVGERLGVTCIIVSHDHSDMLPWADEIIVLRDGKIVQQGTPQHIYKEPVNEYVAGLFGRYNTISPALTSLLSDNKHHSTYTRPEDLAISTDPENGIPAIVTRVQYMGSHYQLHLMAAAEHVTANTTDSTIKTGMKVYVRMV